MEVRDPIHGGIALDADEAAVIQSPYLQRLRGIRQLGYSSVPFPGATHSRFAHVLGAMELAGRAFDRAYSRWTFDRPGARRRFRAAVRLAALCHDLGHAPYSHCTEFAMPPLRDLKIHWYRGEPADRRATHEDYTVAVLEQTALRQLIDQRFPCEARHVAALISSEIRTGDDFFRDGGLDHRRLLSQIISSELDVDRLDYLVRDAYYSGAKYGTVDVPWILSNLGTHTADGQVGLSLDTAALYAFEDFLVSRHHMFLQVYFHHNSVIYEEMLHRHVADAVPRWSIPASLDEFLYCDDVSLEHHLRASQEPWARRIVERTPYRRVMERHGPPAGVRLQRHADALAARGIDAILSESTGLLSRYAVRSRLPGHRPIFVSEPLAGRTGKARTLTSASRVFERYAGGHSIARIYVDPEQVEAARDVLGTRDP